MKIIEIISENNVSTTIDKLHLDHARTEPEIARRAKAIVLSRGPAVTPETVATYWASAMQQATRELEAEKAKKQRADQEPARQSQSAKPRSQIQPKQRSSSTSAVRAPVSLGSAIKDIPGVNVAQKYISMGSELSGLFKESRQDDK
jgi:hypothetical protein